jgi:chromate reductase, NAD(P)H dehydrogenase (quinone)
MRVLGISGSLRRESHNTRLLRAAAALLPEDAELTILDPELLRAIPPYDDDIQASGATPWAVRVLRETIAQSDAVLFATPEYNHSIPGVLKNALDWVSRPLASSPLRGRDVAVVGASTGMFGAVWAQAELRKVLAAIGARVVDRELPVMQAADAFTPDGDMLADSGQHEQLAEHVAALVDAVRVSDELQSAA